MNVLRLVVGSIATAFSYGCAQISAPAPPTTNKNVWLCIASYYNPMQIGELLIRWLRPGITVRVANVSPSLCVTS